MVGQSFGFVHSITWTQDHLKHEFSGACTFIFTDPLAAGTCLVLSLNANSGPLSDFLVPCGNFLLVLLDLVGFWLFFAIWIFYNFRLTDQMSSNSHISTLSIEMIFM